jgi:hypothetical protein
VVAVILVASVREGNAIINFLNAARQLGSVDTWLWVTAMPKDETGRESAEDL